MVRMPTVVVDYLQHAVVIVAIVIDAVVSQVRRAALWWQRRMIVLPLYAAWPCVDRVLLYVASMCCWTTISKIVATFWMLVLDG